eukprot:8217567-Pyramimonas_sp.AAC.1
MARGLQQAMWRKVCCANYVMKAPGRLRLSRSVARSARRVSMRRSLRGADCAEHDCATTGRGGDEAAMGGH